MVRLTIDLVQKALKFVNPLNQVEIDLRGYKISIIENLGATQDVYEVIDLTGNEIVALENFPFLSNLTTLLLNNNKINKIEENLGTSVPNLNALVLTNNKFTELSELVPIRSLKNIQVLSFVDNPVQKVEHYRDLLIYLLPQLRTLDFHKVKKEERTQAELFFKSKEGIALMQKLTAKSNIESNDKKSNIHMEKESISINYD